MEDRILDPGVVIVLILALIYVFLCVKAILGSKNRVRILIGPYPTKSPSFIEVKNEDGIQIQINLVTYGIVKKHSGLYSSKRWIELID